MSENIFDQLRFIHPTSWSEIFSVWKANEGADPIWQEFAKKEKGWETWEQWRSYQSSFLEADKLEWKSYEILEPNKTIPQFLIGPFQGWQKHFEQKNVKTFEELVQEKTDWVQNNVGVKTRRADFPQGTQFIGLYLEDKQNIVLYEGHHRAAAISLAVFENQPIVFTSNPTIALTTISGDSTKLLNYLLANKAKKPIL